MTDGEYVIPFEQGRLYNRRLDIHGQFGGQQQGGISTPKTCPYIFLFTGETGEQYGYSDGWSEHGVFHYTGEGQHGDMTFVRGNRAIRDHAAGGKELLLFQLLEKGRPVRFIGPFSCASWDYVDAPDADGAQRRAIVFHLIPDETVPAAPADSGQSEVGVDLATLRDRALKASSSAEAGKQCRLKKKVLQAKQGRSRLCAGTSGRHVRMLWRTGSV